MRSLVFAFLLVFVFFIGLGSGSILFYDPLDSTPDPANWKPHIVGGSFDVSSDYSLSGGNSWKYTLGYGQERSEHTLLSPNFYILDYEAEYWVGYALYFPTGTELQRCTMGQLHGRPDHPRYDGSNCGTACDYYRNPLLSIGPSNVGDVLVTHKAQISRCGWDQATCSVEYDSARWRTVDYPWKVGSWNYVVLNFKLSYSGTGFNKVYLNGDLVYDYSGNIGYNDDVGPYWKMGQYCNLDSTQEVYYDEFRVGDSSSSYSEVVPRAGTSGDVTAPFCSSGLPSGVLSSGTTQTTISLVTDEVATCRYSGNSGVLYSVMEGVFSDTGGTAHSGLVTGLLDGEERSYYVRCEDSSGNVNLDDYVINFSIGLNDSGEVICGDDVCEGNETCFSCEVDCGNCSGQVEPIAYYNFDEGTGEVLHDFGGGNDGVINGATWVSGKVGGALAFDGIDDYVDIGDRVEPEGEFTMSVWAKPNGDQTDKVILAKYSSIPAEYEIMIGTAGSYIARSDVGPSYSNSIFAMDSVHHTAYPDWVHVVGVYGSDDKMKIYVNGVLKDEGVVFSRDVSRDDSFTIGRRSYVGAEGYFNGTIDEVKIYDRALSEAEVLELFSEANVFYHSADVSPRDGCVDFFELNSYLQRWLDGEVSLKDFVSGVGVWKVGC